LTKKNERMAEKIKVCNFDKKNREQNQKRDRIQPEQLQGLLECMEKLFAIFKLNSSDEKQTH